MARKGKLVRSASDKLQYTAYALEQRYKKNKLARAERTKKKQPNNEQLQDVSEKYTRNRKSLGHICKGIYTSLGFDKNNPTLIMSKGKAPVHLYQAGNTVFGFNHTVPNHGKSMREQLESLGFEIRKLHGKRKHKKTSR